MDKNLNLICGDAIKELKKLSDSSIDLITTDPPYNLSKDYEKTNDNLEHNEYLDFSRQWIQQCYRVLKPNGTIYVFMGMKYISYIYQILEETGFFFNSWITWFYTQGIGRTKGFSPRHDDILMFTKNQKNFTFNLDNIRVPQKFYRSVNNMRGANPGNVWEFSHIHYCNSQRQPHPTQKPEGLYERMILVSSNSGDTVLDPFCGSGTCIHVCQHTERNCISIDNNPNYIKMAQDRINSKFTGFDSIDERMYRVPNDLNDRNIRMKYVKNHIDWFLNNHEDAIEKFKTDIKNKYAGKIDPEEEMYINML